MELEQPQGLEDAAPPTKDPLAAYWAKKPPAEFADVLLAKAKRYCAYLEESARARVWERSEAMYYGRGPDGWTDSTIVKFSGVDGEVVNLTVNHYGAVLRLIHATITATRPSFESQAINTAVDAIRQVKLADMIADYYLVEKKGEENFRKIARYALIYGEGWEFKPWNPRAGALRGADPETQAPTYEGDFEDDALTPFDVIRDVTVESIDKLDWLMVRRPVSRWTLAATFPAFAEHISGLQHSLSERGNLVQHDALPLEGRDEDTIYVFYFFHQKTAALPQGRFSVLVGDKIVFNGTLPYESMFDVVNPMVPEHEVGKPFGVSFMWDAIGPQQAYDSIVSAGVTNHDAFAVQNVWTEENDSIETEDLPGGLRHLKSRTKPEAVQLLAISEHTYKLEGMFRELIETITGANAVARGNPQASLKSGSALALVQSTMVQFASGTQGAFALMCERSATSRIATLRLYATVPRVVEIVGRDQLLNAQTFVSENLKGVRRVKVSLSDPMMRTPGGRKEIADKLLDKGVIPATPQGAKTYLAIQSTGKVELATDPAERHLLNAREENEKLLSGEQVHALFTDDSVLHLNEHASLLDSTAARENPELVRGVREHVFEHLAVWRDTPPELLTALGLMPYPAPAAPPGEVGPDGEPVAPAQEAKPGGPPGNPNPTENGAEKAPRADMPPPPGGEAKLPLMPKNPVTGERAASPAQ